MDGISDESCSAEKTEKGQRSREGSARGNHPPQKPPTIRPGREREGEEESGKAATLVEGHVPTN